MPVEHVNVLIIGAGLSGIGAACLLQERCPDRSYAILEARDAIGGTWDLFRYPGVRSDSDMYTLGYAFRPWKDARAIADGESIREYVRDTAVERGVVEQIRFQHKVVSAEWSTVDAQWTVEARRTDTDKPVRFTCDFLYACTGYYRYDQGYTPEFPGAQRFTGPIVHPQHWPEQLDYTGKRVVVIGSGATAVTVVPAMAQRAAQVTMLQRSPSYVLSLPSVDPRAEWLRRRLPRRAYQIVRWKNVLAAMLLFQLSRRRPAMVKRMLRRGAVEQLPAGYPVDVHFAPGYGPWDQRMCFIPDGDLFAAIRDGSASVVTDQIETFTEHGIRLASGTDLPADIIVTATGLNLLSVGGLSLRVDGSDVDVAKTVAYKGMMLSGVPNFAFAVGYTNASWTLRCDLVSGYVCRLLNHMRRGGYQICTPVPPDPSLPTAPIIDLASGYVRRGVDRMPRQGRSAPWRMYQNYPRDILLMRYGRLDGKGITFTRAGTRERSAAQV
ncbi:MAG: NAD(P)/FAD-dependent oxidoreductase [Micromonosporaceae bacterium]|nr:NAD(P)/FAD-dependent oxidoreductase [Micromonosporaceae bacterium]